MQSTSSSSSPDQLIRRRILLVDDHPVICLGFSELINVEPDLVVCGTAGDAHQAMESIKTLKPDLAIVDLSLKESSGLNLIRSLRVQASSIPILVMSMHDEKLFAERVLRAGALGYIMKQAATDEILIAIRRVIQEEVYLSPHMVTQLMRAHTQGRGVESDTPLSSLSDRELEVFQLISEGHSRRQIATTLHLSVKTVETHRAHIMRKLHLANAIELNRFALQWSTSLGVDLKLTGF